MNIVLIGYRGTGKSHVGTLLAQRLGKQVVSMDAEIVKDAGMGVPQIVEQRGWPGFRDLETEQARKLAGRDNLVIDCGGGVIEREENIDILRQKATIFWLKASVDAIVARIGDDNQRPALTEGKSFTEEVAEVLDVRTPKYQAAAQHAIDTDVLTPQQVAERILEILKQS
ncbi:MAG: shikimate kinase [Desulfuromonadales bacterium]|nr:shikimate kinase [Desulfuromonadales bacterium]